MTGAVCDGVRAKLMLVRVEMAVVERMLRSSGTSSKRQFRYIADILDRCTQLETELMNGE